MDPVSVDTVISRPPREVFAYLRDIANHPEFLDNLFEDWHLTREDTIGRGAGARFHLKQRFNRFAWMDQTFVEVTAPRRIVGVGRTGKVGRVRVVTEWHLEPEGQSATHVAFSIETQPRTLAEKGLDVVWGTRGFYKRRAKRSLARLRDILEGEKVKTGPRASIAGGARKPATNAPFR